MRLSPLTLCTYCGWQADCLWYRWKQYNHSDRRSPMTEPKPLNWKPEPGIGYRVVRRPDGGMTVTVTDLSDATIQHWHNFALEHLLGSDRLTRNLYDLRQVKVIPEKAVRTAIEV